MVETTQLENSSSTRVWSPNPKQEIFLSIPDEVFEALYGGGAYGGKTEVIGLLPVVRGFINNPRFKGLLLRRTNPESEKEIIPRMMEYYTGGCKASWNGTQRCWTFPSRAKIFVGHMENEEDKRKYDSDEFQYIGWDEVTSFTPTQYLYVIGSRCRSSISDLPAFTRAGTNPGNVSHDFFKNRFKVDEPKVPPGTIIKDRLTGNLRIFIKALPTDNTKVPEDKLQAYLNSLELLPEHEKQAKKYGSWSSFEGQVFGDFRPIKLPNEPGNALHVIPAHPIPKHWPCVLAMDWGFSAYFYAMWGAIAPNKRVYIFKEYAEKGRLTSEAGADICNLSRDVNIVDIVVDPATKQKTGEELNKFEQIYNALKAINIQKLLRTADNDRIGGKLLLQEFIRWRPLPVQEVTAQYDNEYAQYLLRWNGIEAYNDYLASFSPLEEEHDLPRLQIFDTCPVLIKTIPLCIYNTIEGKKEDVKEFSGDDPYDDIRYFLKAIQRYDNTSKKEDNKVQAEVDIIEHFEKTQDYNVLAMQMRKLQSKQFQMNRPMRRFHDSRKDQNLSN
jgi:hypothetical protein